MLDKNYNKPNQSDKINKLYKYNKSDNCNELINHIKYMYKEQHKKNMVYIYIKNFLLLFLFFIFIYLLSTNNNVKK